MKHTEKIAGEYSIDSTCVTIISDTNSTSTTTGALVVAGGVGVTKDICVGGNLYATGNTVIGDANTDSVCFTADVISHIIPDTDETYNLGSAPQKWNCVFVKTIAAGIISATDTTNSTSTTTGAITNAGGLGVACDVYIGGAITVDSTTNSTNGTTGSIQTDGGLGVTCDAYIAGAITVDSTTNSTSGTTGSIQTDGGIGVACDAYIAGKLTMSNVVQLHTATSDPAGAEGQIYYKSDTCKFRGYANGAWTNLHQDNH